MSQIPGHLEHATQAVLMHWTASLAIREAMGDCVETSRSSRSTAASRSARHRCRCCAEAEIIADTASSPASCAVTNCPNPASHPPKGRSRRLGRLAIQKCGESDICHLAATDPDAIPTLAAS